MCGVLCLFCCFSFFRCWMLGSGVCYYLFILMMLNQWISLTTTPISFLTLSYTHTHTHSHTHTHILPPPPSTRSVSHTMHFKQKGISGLSWKELPPGQTTLYVFDDPLKPRKLLLHCGHSILNPKRWEMHDYSFLKCQLGWIIWCLSSLKSWYQCTYWPVHLIYDLLVPI